MFEKKDLFNLMTIAESIEKIIKYTGKYEKSDDFFSDNVYFDATMMQFVIIGETTNKLSQEFKEKYSTISWQDIKNFRNIIAHNYFGIDVDEVWDIIKNHIPKLKNSIMNLIDSKL